MQSDQAHVLIVEDEEAHIEFIKRTFNKLDKFRLEFTTSIGEAYQYILNNNPDLIITDYLLPDGKGIALLEKLEVPYPIIIMTSHGDEKIAVEAMKNGALDYVPKSADLLLELPHIAERALREWEHITKHKKMETQLKEEHDFTTAVLNTSGALVVVLNSDGMIISFNRACEEATGYSLKKGKNKSFFDLIIPQGEQEDLKNALHQLMDGVSHVEGENYFQHKNLIKSLIAWSMTRVKTQQYPEGSFIITGLDITERKQMEAALKESEEKYRSLVENINDVIFTMDMSGIIVYISPSINAVTGFTPQDMIGNNLNYIFMDSQGEYLNLTQKNIKMNQETSFECQLASSSKEKLWFRVSTHPIIKGEVTIGYQGIMTEITKRKQIEFALIESQEKYRALAENSPDIIMRFDSNLNLLYVSPSIKKIHTTDSIDLINKNIVNVNFPKNITNFWTKNVKDVFQKGKTIDRSHRVVFQNEKHDFNWQLVPEYDAVDNIKSVLCSGRDITSQKRAQARIEESETFFRQLFQQNENAVLLISNDGKIIDANPAATKLYDYSKSELIKGGLKLLLSSKMYSIIKKTISAKPLKERFHYNSINSLKKDETEIIIDIQGKQIKLQGKEVFYCNIIDVTQKLFIEEQMRMAQAKLIHENKMASLGLLVSGIGHEINNPNNLIMFNAPLLKDVWKDIFPILKTYYLENGDFLLSGIPFSEMQNDIPELLNGIHDGSIRIKDIINNLREFVRPESTDALSDVDINHSIKMSTNILNSQIKKHTDYFSIHYDNNLPIISGNRQKLEQVFINLIVNALQALPSKQHSVQILTSHNKENNNICIAVKDEGIGMSSEILSRITEPFFSTKLDSGGTGLGLSISYSIIKEHKGSLEFHSAPGKGTEAIINLPCKKHIKE